MTTTAEPLTTAVLDLERELALRGDAVPPANWRWVVRQRLAAMGDALIAESGGSDDAWLAARGGAMLRERNHLLARAARLGVVVLETEDLDAVGSDLHRLVVDVTHHVQRRHDLAYDDVVLELGGSE